MEIDPMWVRPGRTNKMLKQAKIICMNVMATGSSFNVSY